MLLSLTPADFRGARPPTNIADFIPRKAIVGVARPAIPPIKNMTTPASRLADILSPGVLLPLRGMDGRIEKEIGYQEALAEIIVGGIEGVGPPSGRIKYLRRIPEQQREPAKPELLALEALMAGKSTVVAKTNIGAYREALTVRPVIAGVTLEAEVIAHCWSFRMHKRRSI